jgi:pimeloyl-ACP methyl ester carboxylesterase
MNKKILFFIATLTVLLFIDIAQCENRKDGWLLVQKKQLSLQPEITHYKYEIALPPYTEHDKIGLHRLINETVKPKGAFFVFPGTHDSGFKLISDEFIENIISSINKHINEPNKRSISLEVQKELTSIPNRLITRFLAANGYDVYTIDYRTFYVPLDTPADKTEFMKDWGWDFFVNDAKVAIDKAKELSGFKKIFLAGESFGGMLAMNYTSRYWQDDIKGLIELDGGNGGKYKLRIPLELWKLTEGVLKKYIPDLPELSIADKASPKILQFLISNYLTDIIFNNLKMYSLDQQPADDGTSKVMEAVQTFLNIIGIPVNLGGKPDFANTQYKAFTDLLADPINLSSGDYLKPYCTGSPCPTYMNWAAEYVYSSPIKALFTNYKEGYNTPLGLALNNIYNSRHWPLEVFLETIGMYEFEFTTSNEPIELLKTLGIDINLLKLPEAAETALKMLNKDTNSTGGLGEMVYFNKNIASEFNYPEHYKDIDVPIIVFEGRLGILGFGPTNNSKVLNKDITNGGAYPELGHIDVYTGTTNFNMINKPTLSWMENHL